MPSTCSGTASIEFLVEMRQDLGVAMGVKNVPTGEQARSQLRIVVKLAVLRRPDVSRFIRHRLPAAFDIDDAEPARAEREPFVADGKAIVGSAMMQRREHRVDGGAITAPEYAGNSTHD